MQGNSLTGGNIVKSLLGFTGPFLLANFLQGLYSNVDALVVGNFSDSAEMAAVATGGTIMMTITNLVMGLTTGGTVLIAQYYGAEDYEDVNESIGTMFTIFFAISIVLTGVLLLLAEPIVNVMQVPGEAEKAALSYTRICYIGLIFTMGYNIVSAMLRGMGDSKNPLIFIGIACVVNIILDLLLVAVFNMGAAGAAIATTLAQAVSFVISVIYLRLKDFSFDFKLHSFVPSGEKIRHLLRLGVPIGAQNLLASASFMVIMAIINNMGVTASAATGVGDKISAITQMPAMAFSSAIAAFAAQNMGASQPDRALHGFKLGLIVTVAIGVIFSAAMAIFPGTLMDLYTNDDKVIDIAWQYMWPYAAETLLVSFAFSYSGFFNGCGKASVSMAAHLISTFAVRIPVAILLGSLEEATLFHVTLSAPISSAVQTIILIIYMRTKKWRTGAVIDNAEKLNAFNS